MPKKAAEDETPEAEPCLVVQSKIKELVKSAEMNLGGDFVDGLSVRVNNLVADAVGRAQSNDRKTVRASDL